ncbi:MAG: biopolymer transporter ExbD [Spirochaetes bacterium]|nr:biopolymer transporter ExbD [Spirochaetota bacterium]
MRIKRKQRERSIASIEMTPLIDMVFLLLIFFLLSTTLDNFRRLNIKLPSSQTGEKVKTKDLSIYIDRENNIYLENQIVSLKILDEKLKSIDKESISTVFINGDENTQYKIIIDIMDILRKNGFFNISLGVKSY